jgi:glycosyltransferase involved in cell wall biosynthesis
MARIAIISQSPTLTTGFGVTTKAIADFLSTLNHEVTCFGIDQMGETFERKKYNYKIWTVGGLDLHKSFYSFLKHVNPEIVVVNFDIVTVGRWYSTIKSLKYKGKLYTYVIFDGTPFLLAPLDFLNDFQKVIVPTLHTKNYLLSKNIQNVVYAPHGVDLSTFIPIANKFELRKKLKLHEKILIGCFGRNTERKQQAKILQAIKILVENYPISNYQFYFHCTKIDNLKSWNLELVSQELGIEKYVYFPKDLKNQLDGISVSKSDLNLHQIEDLGLVQRIGICDLCINIPFCGGFEILNLEVQACGVPLITTNDKGNIAEIVGKECITVDTDNIHIWATGAYQYFVNEKVLADTIYQTLSNENILRNQSFTGRKNAEGYTWDLLNEQLILLN